MQAKEGTIIIYGILVRAISYTVHGLIPASCVFADRYNREEVVRSLGKEVNINPPLMLGQLPDTPEELLKLDQTKRAVQCEARLTSELIKKLRLLDLAAVAEVRPRW
ncbi:unnamed protein product [Diatraea saccharalis]|uniref:Uncharacterized protein n=1 Tax=Diatraea saccharalis TaxID=40085 RepID=A0A9N9R221_9NEOP|nr:unnamed protein product [Diatraea saccharalis]